MPTSPVWSAMASGSCPMSANDADEIARIRAQWDQAEAAISHLEAEGEDMTASRFQLNMAAALLDHAERLLSIKP